MIGSKLLFGEACRDPTLGGFPTEGIPVRIDERTDELISVSDDRRLLEESVCRQHPLQHLGSDVLTVGRLEEVFQSLGEVERISLDTPCISRTEEAILGESLRICLGIIVVSREDRRALDQDLATRRIDLDL